MALLKITSGDSAGAAFAVGNGSLRVGRAEGNDLLMPDGSVSSAHCEVSLDSSGNLLVRDLNSTNGTFIEGQRVREALVQSGQRLRLGDLELVFEGDTNHSPLVPAMPVSLNLPPPPIHRPAPQPPPEAPVIVGEPGPDDCANHPGVRGAVICMRCQRKACAKCTKQQKLGMSIVDFCLACGGQCKKLSQVAKEAAKIAAIPTSFKGAVTSALKYPLRGNGLTLLLIGTVLYALMDWFIWSPTRFLNFYALVAKLILFVLGYGYLFAYLQRIVTSSAAAEEDPPEWPEVSDIGADIIRPFWQLVFTLLVAVLPAIIVGSYLGPMPARFVQVLGAIYFPMALLAVAMSDSYTGLNPIFVASSIMKIPKDYFMTCLVFVGLEIAWTNVRQVIYEIEIPIIPHVAFWFAFLFVLIVGMRILGMMYYLNRRQLGWGL